MKKIMFYRTLLFFSFLPLFLSAMNNPLDEIDEIQKEIASLELEIVRIDTQVRKVDEELAKKPKISVAHALNQVLKSKNPDLISKRIARCRSLQGLDDLQFRYVNSFHEEAQQLIIHWVFNGGIINGQISTQSINEPRNRLYNSNPGASFEAITRAFNALLLWGVNINKQDSLGNTALHYVSCKKRLHSIELLCAHKLDVNIQNNKKNIPLFELVLQEKTLIKPVKDCVKMLLKYGSDVSVKNAEDKSIIDYVDLLEDSRHEQWKRDQGYGNYLLAKIPFNVFGIQTGPDKTRLRKLIEKYRQP